MPLGGLAALLLGAGYECDGVSTCEGRSQSRKIRYDKMKMR